MALEYDAFRHGGTDFPLTAATTNTLLKDADPFVYYALDFFKSMLTTHLGSRFTAEAAAGAVKNAAGTVLTNVVGQTIGLDPAPFLTAQQFLFPLLALYRVEGTWENRTTRWRHNVTTCRLAYVLPPLDAAQAQRMMPLLTAVARVIDARCEQGMQANYTPPGSTAGTSAWALADIEQVTVLRERYGRWEGADDLLFPALMLDIEVRERDESTSGTAQFDDLTAVNADINLDPNTGEATYDDLVQIAVDTEE